jgi:uncharacterized membrane protein YkoI
MRKSLFLAAGLALALTSCTKEQGITPDDSGNHLGFDDKGGGSSSSSSSTSSVNITLTATQKAAVEAVIASKYAGYKIKEAEQELEHGVVFYKVTIVSGSAKIKLLFSADWKFIGEKK